MRRTYSSGRDAAIKLHTVLDLRGPLLAFLASTAVALEDLVCLEGLLIEPVSFNVIGRGYVRL
jgi:hypothetical protein